MAAHDIILSPILSEKTTALRDLHAYCFRVHPKANKIQICQAVNELFSVKPRFCRTMNVKPKPKRVRVQRGYTSRWKKAIVFLEKGTTIPVLGGV